jgi:hypothetical protein
MIGVILVSILVILAWWKNRLKRKYAKNS